MKYITLVLILISFSMAGEKKTKALEMLSTAKFAGACGIYNAQVEWGALMGQKQTFHIFWSAEAARLGLSMNQWVKVCSNVLTKYEFYNDVVQKNL